jgi:hypothetical protein
VKQRRQAVGDDHQGGGVRLDDVDGNQRDRAFDGCADGEIEHGGSNGVLSSVRTRPALVRWRCGRRSRDPE